MDYLIKVIPVLLILLLSPAGLSGFPTNQDDSSSNQMLKVFIDCEDCDMDFMREEVKFINYVRDKELAQVHVFVTDIRTGGGGRTYHLDFIGKMTFEGRQDSLTYTSLPTETHDEIREGLKNTIVMGLMSYIARMPYANSLKIKVDKNGNGKRPEVLQTESDKWNYWIFEINGGGEIEKESQQSDYSIRAGFEAQRITDNWKTVGDFYQRYRERTVNSDGEMMHYIYREGAFYFDQVKSMGEHWSMGISGNVQTSTYENTDLSLGASLAGEYSIFPYREVARREFTVSYHIGLDYQQYLEETVFLKMKETLPIHDLRLGIRFNQPWGYARAHISASQYLHDFSKFHVGTYGRLSWRIFKGLSIYLSGNYGIVRNQLYLPREEVTLEEVLLRQKRIATEYELECYLGIGYTFGSIYNNVVNTRL
jgi:hypothetical protein